MAILAFLVPHQLERPIGDDLVDVHVRRRAGAALEDVELELIVELSVDDFLAGPVDAAEDVIAELLAIVIGAGGRALDHGQRLDQVGIEVELDT